MFGQRHNFLFGTVTVKARIVAVKRLTGTRLLPDGVGCPAPKP
jgi:hypothetical protein